MTHLGPSLRRRKRPARPWRRVSLAIAISILVNLLVLREVRVDFAGRSARETVRPVALAPLSPSQWAANRALGNAPSESAARPPAAPQKAPPQPNPAPGQVVEVAPSKDQTPPKSSRFLAEQNNTVDKETRSRYARPGYPSTLPKPSEPKQAMPQKPQIAGEAGPGSRTPAGGRDGKAERARKSAGEAPLPKQAERDKLALRFNPNAELRNREAQPDVQRRPGVLTPGLEAGKEGEEGFGHPGRNGPLDASKLMPGASTYDRLAGGPAPDHLDGIEEGEGTYLNTREWKYAGYFNRIKQAVASHWDPNRALQLRDPTGNLYAYKDRITVLVVTLDGQGTLKDVAVQKTCGVDFLDRTAIDAFRTAQPFVNPPRGLADGNGDIKFTFGFYLEVGSSALRFLRTPISPPP